MAARQVVVRRLVAIENFGGMDILCTDKTGTLTEGRVRVHAAIDAEGRPSPEVLRLAFLNASLQSGFDNPIDAAIRAEPGFTTKDVRKLDEVPYDFSRRRLSVLIEQADGRRVLVTKGAFREVLAACSASMTADGTMASENWRDSAILQIDELSEQGLRCLGVASRDLGGRAAVTPADERDMTFAGIIALADPPKADAGAALETLHGLGIRVKMITGDHRAVAANVAGRVGLSKRRIVTGSDLDRLTEHALQRRARTTDVFAEVDPNQKERIILALKRGGASVGYLGDGINDAAALHAADVGISVDTAVDATRRAADIVLLRKDLCVLAEGVEEGRRAFANTLKYVFVTTSANFGNMFSMAGASLATAFLPMLPKQILLLNLLSDVPALAIATDRLDAELVARPRRWDVGFIRAFMITFGLVSSFFDFLTFGLLLLLAVPAAQFRTAWFVESVLTEIGVLLVIRTGRVFFRSAPSRPLLFASLGAAAITVALPFVPGTELLGFAPLSPALLGAIMGITALLVAASESAKRVFFARHPLGGSGAPVRLPGRRAARS